MGSILVLLVQGMLFGNGFVYEGATGARDLSGEITQIPVLKGMHTNAETAEELEALYNYLEENDLLERECILYGDIPGIAYFMELKPAINIWSDLRSYGIQTMLADLEQVENKIQAGEEYPLVIINKKYEGYCSMGDESCLPEEETARQKLIDLCGFMYEQGYQNTPQFVNGSFVVYME